MTLKGDPNFEETLTFCLKNDMRNLANFNASSGKCENLHFDWLRLFQLKKYRGFSSGKMTYGFKNGTRNLANIPTSS